MTLQVPKAPGMVKVAGSPVPLENHAVQMSGMSAPRGIFRDSVRFPSMPATNWNGTGK